MLHAFEGLACLKIATPDEMTFPVVGSLRLPRQGVRTYRRRLGKGWRCRIDRQVMVGADSARREEVARLLDVLLECSPDLAPYVQSVRKRC